jgi:bifunctional ADP-heptose synthase (sugar kinase/adenylyltransferase)
LIVETHELVRYRGAVTMVDGGFDPIHPGHVAYFHAAADLGAPVLCNVSGDSWVGRKHPPLLPHGDRVVVIDAIRWVDFVHESLISTEEVLRLLQPRFYAKGADWRERLPQEQVRICADHSIEIVYLDTVLDSSSAILERYRVAEVDRT